MTTWPSIEQYALAHRCPTCQAEPNQPCDAPRKAGRPHVTRYDTIPEGSP